MLYGLFFIIVQYLFMYCEPIETISGIHSRLRGFIEGMSPACVDDEAPCVDISDVHSWPMMLIWGRQSLINPIWGDYGGATGFRCCATLCHTAQPHDS